MNALAFIKKTFLMTAPKVPSCGIRSLPLAFFFSKEGHTYILLRGTDVCITTDFKGKELLVVSNIPYFLV